jgi:hypothetical protein
MQSVVIVVQVRFSGSSIGAFATTVTSTRVAQISLDNLMSTQLALMDDFV